jgi:hypothetical protein
MEYKNKYLKYKKKYLELQKQVGGGCFLGISQQCQEKKKEMEKYKFKTYINEGLELDENKFNTMIRLKNNGFNDELSFTGAKYFNEKQIDNMLIFKYFKFNDNDSYSFAKVNADIYKTINGKYKELNNDKINEMINEMIIINSKNKGKSYNEDYIIANPK